MKRAETMTTHTILDAIGNTPLVEVTRLNPNPRVRILAKLEYVNPGGSIKDRAALSMIEYGEKTGELTPDKTVIEATSGNTGIGLAMVCSVKGYRLKLAMSEAVSEERQKILRARGAEIVLTPGHLGTDGAIDEVTRLVAEHPEAYYRSNQYSSPANWMAHYHGTGPEIWAQCDGLVDCVVASMGTTGTLMGLSRRMKEYRDGIRIVGVEPYLGHGIQGLKNMKEANEPPIYERRRLDAKVNVEDDEAFEMTRRLAAEEGLFVGMSSGAAMVAAVKEAESMESGTVVVVLPDGGERYLSTHLFSVKDKPGPMLYNTRTGRREVFAPRDPGVVTLYSCGPTVHQRMDLSLMRRFLFSDLLSRYLSYRGFSVRHVINITDLDDKTIAGAAEKGVPLAEFTRYWIDLFHKDLAALTIKAPEACPKVSDHVDKMVDVTEELLKKGVAYEKLRSVYFDISQVESYGRMSGVDLEKIRLGATVDLDEYEKENPRDFTLFKRTRGREREMGVSIATRWGRVRPSLHVQCAAISMAFLGGGFDIHTSSRELLFPHHENEEAIARALTGDPLARFWLHCDRVLVHGRKIEGSGSRMTLEEIRDLGFDGRVLRYWLLSGHYRKPLHFSSDRLEEAAKALAKIDACIKALMNRESGRPFTDLDQVVYDIRRGLIDAMDDDLNVSRTLAVIFRAIRRINALLGEGWIDADGAKELLKIFRDVDQVLGVFDFAEGKGACRDEVASLLAERSEARENGAWERADALRERLEAMGVTVRDARAAGNA
ncbi:cysteine synthase [Desulfoluna spongiiphila]|uniref:Cysteine--tRNA ligase n=1 Tax=Desulfoluna spongiiphila TaxID=419481 RepID=A0A1G5H245_9BACT|nr:cysteine synthase [Desulfoluna spongiiphila]SCY57846.1 cysteinyl-tRNA synthetase [Desulfoluna spongiiphila]VVS94738.1 cysteine-trna ligase [Desulfoluna spongiiphila]